MELATHVLQTYLDDIGFAVLQDDWKRYRAGICLPFVLVTHDETIVLDNDEDLRAGFDTFAQSLRIQRVTDFMRLVEGAERLDESLITGRYVTHVLAGGHRLMPPFRSQITLRLEDGVWRSAVITNALANARQTLPMSAAFSHTVSKGPKT